MNWPALIFFALGVVFAAMGNLGVLIFPDVYTRLQASSTCSTTSILSILVGCMIIAGISATSGKIVVITLFFFVTNPIASHIIARYAFESDMIPWRRSHGRIRFGEPADD
jgi:multicomponent Na+:H+ antiporter subunit G